MFHRKAWRRHESWEIRWIWCPLSIMDIAGISCILYKPMKYLSLMYINISPSIYTESFFWPNPWWKFSTSLWNIFFHPPEFPARNAPSWRFSWDRNKTFSLFTFRNSWRPRSEKKNERFAADHPLGKGWNTHTNTCVYIYYLHNIYIYYVFNYLYYLLILFIQI